MGVRDSIDLTSAHLKIVTDLLDQFIPDMEVWAYGSRVKWTSHPASDLDLVAFASSEQTNCVSRLKEAFEQSNLPLIVDIHIWDQLPSHFHEQITKNYMVLRKKCPDEIPRSSRTVLRLGEFTPLAYGKGLPASKRSRDGQIPVYGSNGIVGYHDTALTSGPTVIVGRKGTVGAVHYSSTPCWPIDTTFYIEGSDSDMVRFKYYTLKSLQLDKMNSDSAVPGLNRSHAHSLKVHVPPPSEQRTIARFLGALDDKIAVLLRTARTLEATAQALFKSWFIDYDPVRAKTEGRSSGLPPDLDTLFPTSFKSSELGPIPKGWSARSLDDIANFLNGLALQKYPPASGEALPIIKIAQLRSGNLQGADLASVDLDPKYVVEDGDILFSWSGSLECRIWTSGRGALNQHLFKVIPNSSPTWLCYFAIHEHLSDFREVAAGKATTMGHIQRHHLRDAKLAIPPKTVVERLNPIMSPVLERSVAAALDVSRLRSLREALLPILLSGQLQVTILEPSVTVAAIT